jgi:hypothetical protein
MNPKKKIANRMLRRNEHKKGALRMGSFAGVKGMVEGVFASRSWSDRRTEKARAVKRRQDAAMARSLMRRQKAKHEKEKAQDPSEPTWRQRVAAFKRDRRQKKERKHAERELRRTQSV